LWQVGFSSPHFTFLSLHRRQPLRDFLKAMRGILGGGGASGAFLPSFMVGLIFGVARLFFSPFRIGVP
jgi:hypothetical protein